MKNAIIAGNAPSLTQIDYNRLPLQFDVFRCNQFYFEDKYYLGKHIKAVFFAPHVFFEQYYTLKELEAKDEYSYDEIFCSKNEVTTNNINFKEIFSISNTPFIVDISDFYEFISYHNFYKNSVITTGVYMCAIAIAMGYRQIFVAGIDFYKKMGGGSKQDYAFNTKTDNLLKLVSSFSSGKHFCLHNKQIDLEALIFLQKKYNVKIYSLCQNSTFSKHFELAPITHNKFIIENKPQNFIKDIMIPPKVAYRNLLKYQFRKILPNGIKSIIKKSIIG